MKRGLKDSLAVAVFPVSLSPLDEKRIERAGHGTAGGARAIFLDEKRIERKRVKNFKIARKL